MARYRVDCAFACGFTSLTYVKFVRAPSAIEAIARAERQLRQEGYTGPFASRAENDEDAHDTAQRGSLAGVYIP